LVTDKQVRRLFADLSSAPAERLRELLAGETVPVSRLFLDLEDEVLTKTLRGISVRALEDFVRKRRSDNSIFVPPS